MSQIIVYMRILSATCIDFYFILLHDANLCERYFNLITMGVRISEFVNLFSCWAQLTFQYTITIWGFPHSNFQFFCFCFCFIIWNEFHEVSHEFFVVLWIADHKTFLRTPKRLCKTGVMNPPPKCSSQPESTSIFKGTANTYDFTDRTSRTTLLSLSDRSSMLTPTQSIANYSEGDLLLDLPSNADYAEAELLYHTRRGKRIQNASTTDSRQEATDGPSSSFQ